MAVISFQHVVAEIQSKIKNILQVKWTNEEVVCFFPLSPLNTWLPANIFSSRPVMTLVPDTPRVKSMEPSSLTDFRLGSVGFKTNVCSVIAVVKRWKIN